MSLTKELIEQERLQVQAGNLRDVHLHREDSFLRAYDWSAYLCCRLLHDFKVSKRAFKGIDEPVAYIGFPETSLPKWTPEGAQQRAPLYYSALISSAARPVISAASPTTSMFFITE